MIRSRRRRRRDALNDLASNIADRSLYPNIVNSMITSLTGVDEFGMTLNDRETISRRRSIMGDYISDLSNEQVLQMDEPPLRAQPPISRDQRINKYIDNIVRIEDKYFGSKSRQAEYAEITGFWDEEEEVFFSVHDKNIVSRKFN